MAREKGQRRRSSARHVTGVLDIGTSKVACIIAAMEPAGLRVLGVGHQRAEGMKGGVVIDLDRAEQAARDAVAGAERQAGVELNAVHVAVACGRLKSLSFRARADIANGLVSDADIDRVLSAGEAYVGRQPGRALVHMNEVAMRLDGMAGSRDPRGMAARELALDLHAVTADEAPVRNLSMVVGRCYLDIASHVPAPLASALAVASEDERRLGVTVVDIGAGTTGIAMFADDRFLYASSAPMGGAQMTFDIARALHTPLAEAERIKALYGTVVSAPSDEHDVFSYPSADDEGIVDQMTKAELAEVIRPRVTAIGHHIRQRLEECEMTAYAGRSVVLTGGVSQLTGLAEFFAAELGRPVRVAGPQAIEGLPPALSSSAFSTAVGLLVAKAQGGASRRMHRSRDAEKGSYLTRVGTWLREGF
ncbi:MAG: cell division protein FtsA [Hyphomicrobium sp.]|uniref:cell division protein FtsA n=1 Tax=Hyphomicrobium sp. TaxID=82 RepID=UPI003D0E96AA